MNTPGGEPAALGLAPVSLAPPGERVKYALEDAPALLWRERRLMAAVFAVVFALGVLIALAIPKQYPAHSSILVRLGPEYVYNPLAGDAGRGTVPSPGQVLQSETDILSSDALKGEVIDELGFGRLHPKEAAAFSAAAPQKKARMKGQAILAMGRSLKIETAPDTPVIGVTYSDSDPARAALVLNTLLDDYLVYRRKVLLDPTTAALDEQRRITQDRLDAADKAYQNFLAANRLGDFETDKTSLGQLQAQVDQQRYAVQAQLNERQGRLAGLKADLEGVPAEIGLYRDLDNTANAKLSDLKVKRDGLLARYQPSAAPVRALNAQIAELQAAIASGQVQGPGAQRQGVNPVYQTLRTEELQMSAEADALKANLAALDRQSVEITDRSLHLSALDPTYQELARQRDVLRTNVKDFTAREDESRAAQEISAQTNDNIRIVERASVPTQAKSLRKPILILAFLFAAFSALCAGLLRLYTRPGLPTAASAARTLELPVLGAAALKA